ncbi:hypothetical protein PENSUB_10334 [Penicillium subrubescens]|uniref:Uncharacterized protein n=1 Tax=Penicillium subrubescens TaxID=1316194 RepID=A0A1Q5TBL8_9EURO|nr:hypothetical protein PENSUB_10334 [Penicillium subrubescens]
MEPSRGASLKTTEDSHLQKARCSLAKECDSKALDDSLAPQKWDIVRVHRSKALLKHGRFDEALSDLNPLPDAQEILEEALLQKSLAAYHLRRYQECWSTILECCQKYPKNIEAETLCSRVLDRVKEI